MAHKTTKQSLKAARKGRAAQVEDRNARRQADAKAVHGELPQWTKAEIEEAFRRFAAANPVPKGELQHINPFTLLVAVVLSAQATDAGVNKATPALFALADTPDKMVKLGEAKVRNLIKTIGLYRTKAKNVIGLSRALIEQHGGQVPHDREALQALPGVGRKTANVVLNIAFGEPTIAVDTHIFRVGNRTGLAVGKTPLDVEMKLMEVVPDKFRLHAHHWLILHGRYTCIARRPLCEKCIIADLCKWPGKTALAAPDPLPRQLENNVAGSAESITSEETQVETRVGAMSTLKVNQIKAKLRTMFEPYLDLSDISSTDKERDQKILSRCLAALAIYSQTGCSPKEAAEAVWDGGDDNGIDGAYFDQSDSRVIFVQSKWINKGAGEPEAKEINTFVKGVADAIEDDQANFHPRLQGKLSDIALRLITPGTSVHLVLVSTGASSLAKHGQSVVDGILDDLNGDDPDGIASAEVMGLSEVYSCLANDPFQGNLSLDATILEWSYIAAPYPAYFGMVDGLQLKTWWKKHGKGLVASNIRHSLGATEVNNEIRQTASIAPDKFWYFNNGITLVADEASKAPAGAASRSAGVFLFRGASIVNGAQTVSSLGRVDNDANLGHVRVPIRVILLKTAPAGFGNEVTRTNNLQNRIEPRDFVAQDPEQRRIRQEMAIEGIDYQFVRSEDATPTATTCELIEVTTALACASGDSNLAVQVKTGIGRFFADLSKAPYKIIFNPSVSGAFAFNATVALRAIEDWIEKKKKTVAKKSGARWGVLVHGNRILAAAAMKKFDTTNFSSPINDFAKSLDRNKLNVLCDGIYEKMVATVEEKYPGKFLAVLFKNPTMSKQIFDVSRT
jgi:endonuclease III